MSARRILLPAGMRGMTASIVHLLPRRSRDTQKKKPTQLTEIEREVLKWLSLGKRFDDIAVLMSISVNAAHQNVHRIKDKLGANTSAGAVAIALRRRLIE